MKPACVVDIRAQVGETPIWDDEAGVLWWIDCLAPSVHRFRPSDGADEPAQWFGQVEQPAEPGDEPVSEWPVAGTGATLRPAIARGGCHDRATHRTRLEESSGLQPGEAGHRRAEAGAEDRLQAVRTIIGAQA